jgi:hypothetical protein
MKTIGAENIDKTKVKKRKGDKKLNKKRGKSIKTELKGKR